MPDSVLNLSCVRFMFILHDFVAIQGCPSGRARQTWGQELQLVHPTNLLTVICAHVPPSHTGHREGVECY